MSDRDTTEIDPLDPDLVRLSDLIKSLPHRPSPPVVCRWCRQGVRGTRLATIKIAGRLLTTRKEFRRFVAAIQEDIPAAPTPAAMESVDRQLREAGYAA